MMKNIIILIFLLLLTSCGGGASKKQAKDDIPQIKQQKGINNEEQKNFALISYNAFIDKTCKGHLETEVRSTRINLNVMEKDSFFVYKNDTCIYKMETNNSFNQFIIIYDFEIKKTLRKTMKDFFVDTTRVNLFEIKFKNLHAVLKFKLLKPSTTITIKQASPVWEIKYSNCVEFQDE